MDSLLDFQPVYNIGDAKSFCYLQGRAMGSTLLIHVIVLDVEYGIKQHD